MAAYSTIRSFDIIVDMPDKECHTNIKSKAIKLIGFPLRIVCLIYKFRRNKIEQLNILQVPLCIIKDTAVTFN